jgi:hypothetical protein
MTRRTFVVVVLVSLLAPSRYTMQPSYAGPSEEEVYAAFEWFCLSHLSRSEQIPELFEQLRVAPLPDDKAWPFLAPQKGIAWLMEGNHSTFIVMLTEQGVCSIAGPRVDGREAAELFEANARHRQLRMERLGSQVEEVLAVTFPNAYGGSDEHAIVILTRSNLATITGIFLNAMPERVVQEAGINVPDWP